MSTAPRLYLYVEDDPLSRQVMELMSKSVLGGVRIEIFEDSTNFMERVRALDMVPSLILLDVHMEPMDGFEMLKLLRADDTYRDTPVIALTASVMNEEISRLHVSGFDGAIAKPISVTTFPGLLRRIMNGETVWHVL